LFAKLWKVALLSLLAYLLQATFASHIALWDISPNIALALLSIVTVGLGRKYAFHMSLLIGYWFEIMMPTMDYISLIMYPVCAMLGALAFSDKSERKREEERSMGKSRKTLDARWRGPLCTGLSLLVFEGFNLVYIYLSGVLIGGGQLFRSFINIAYSSAITGVFQFPIRQWLGIRKQNKDEAVKRQKNASRASARGFAKGAYHDRQRTSEK